jgi:hypothetical protein
VTATVRDARDSVDGQDGLGPSGSRQSRERTGAGTFLTGNASAFRQRGNSVKALAESESPGFARLSGSVSPCRSRGRRPRRRAGYAGRRFLPSAFVALNALEREVVQVERTPGEHVAHGRRLFGLR